MSSGVFRGVSHITHIQCYKPVFISKDEVEESVEVDWRKQMSKKKTKEIE
jgi:hypothetical protein